MVYLKSNMSVNSLNNLSINLKINTSGGRWLLPTDIGALFWIDTLSGVTDIGGFCSQIDDLTPNLRHVLQSTSTRRPAITVDGLSFDGVDDSLFNNSPFMFDTLSGVHVMAIMSAPAPVGTKRFFTESDVTASATSRHQLLCKGNTAGNYGKITQEGRGADNSLYLTYGTYTGTGIAFDNTFKLLEHIDTTTQIKTSINCVSEASPLSYVRSVLTLNRFSIGSLQTTAGQTNPMQAVLKTLAVFPATISQTDLEKAQGSLCHRHGLASLLPAGHPYKINPPLV